MSEETGKLTEKCGEIYVVWTIEIDNIQRTMSFFPPQGFPPQLHAGKESTFYTSPIFFLSDSCWRLRICNWSRNQELLLHLIREDAGPPKTVSFKITGPFESIEGKQSFFTDSATYSKLVNLYYDSSSKMSIYCTLMSEDELPLEESLFERLWNVSLSLRRILAVRENTDVVLKLKSREVRANRLIMESRFPDFARQVDNAIATGEFNIKETDEEAFDTVNSYVHSGEPKGLSSENVCAVYRIARSYGLQGLLKLCKLFLEKNLSVDGVCDVIQMATRCEDVELKESAKKFFAKNSLEVLKTNKWEAFIEENTTLHRELLECLMKVKEMRDEGENYQWF